ncbi:MAG: RNA pseudouridine synthase [Cytophagales bacterium]|nr:MAG: RNA pseudouridine synthase [Cytophagales bacterium]TAF61847.1 MAG: RNA pseudouridine synthase [Cytophagales bacterium]
MIKTKNDFASWIVFESDDYIVINKPSDVSSLDERLGTNTSVLRLGKAYHDDLQLCHRLDKETSGTLVAAKHPAAYRHLAMAFEHREVVKRYHAVCKGVHDFQETLIELPLSATTKGLAQIDFQNGKESATLVTTLKAYRRHTLVECEPITGRLHQIRVHLAAKKAPLVADTQYGGSHLFLSELKKRFNMKKFEEEQPLMKRVALHAFGIQFLGMKGELVNVETPYPKDLQALITQLNKYDA